MSDREIAAIVADFEGLDDWGQRARYLVALGAALPPLPEADKTAENRVRECMSRVHLAVHRDGGVPQRLSFTGDCDTPLIKGLVAILVRLFSHKTLAEIESADVAGLFQALGLEEHLSPNRHLGVCAIVEHMRRQARARG